MLEDGDISPEDQPEFLNKLGKMCRQLETIPDSMRIENCSNGPTDEEYGGGCGTVTRGEHQGRPVAIKTLHLYLTSDFEECFGVSHTHECGRRCILTTGSLEVPQRSHCLEALTTSEHPTVYRCDSGTAEARDGIRVDRSRKHQRVLEESRRSQSCPTGE